MLARNFMLAQHFRQSRQIFISESRSTFRDGFKSVSFLVIRSQKQSTICPSTFSSAVKSSDHHKVNRVLHFAFVISFVLYPKPAARSSLINRIFSNGFTNNAFASVGDSFLEKRLQILQVTSYF